MRSTEQTTIIWDSRGKPGGKKLWATRVFCDSTFYINTVGE